MPTETGLGQHAETESRSVRLRNLPDSVQEGLLQQFLEKLAPIKRVEVFLPIHQAVVEFENAAVRTFTSLYNLALMLLELK